MVFLRERAISSTSAKPQGFRRDGRFGLLLDLVITVDTSVAHLVGAMGCPVWIMLPFTPDYAGARSRRQPMVSDGAFVARPKRATTHRDRSHSDRAAESDRRVAPTPEWPKPSSRFGSDR